MITNKIKVTVVLSIFCLLAAGCTSTQESKQASRRFREASSANVVLQFSSWEYTFLLRPRYDDNGFLLQVPRENVGQVLDKINVRQRELAVVVVGWNNSPEQLNRLVADWKTILGGCGFQRVVILKSSGRKDLNGSLIVDDSNLSGGFAPKLTRL
jgi:hypothetical protein